MASFCLGFVRFQAESLLQPKKIVFASLNDCFIHKVLKIAIILYKFKQESTIETTKKIFPPSYLNLHL